MATFPQEWRAALDPGAASKLEEIERRLAAQGQDGIFPKAADRYRALALVPPADVRVVIVGQDPYPGAGQAMGLSFSVPRGVKVPPSLKNIFKEIRADVGAECGEHGDLTCWAKQGVLLLNTSLSVAADKAASHSKWGWDEVTSSLLSAVANSARPTVFMLWGNHARALAHGIGGNHLVLEAAHPSPLAGGKFFGSRHFSAANAFLAKNNRGTIDWEVV